MNKTAGLNIIQATGGEDPISSPSPGVGQRDGQKWFLMTLYEIFVGINEAPPSDCIHASIEITEETIQTQEYVKNRIIEYLESEKVDFSVTTQGGGYSYLTGSHEREKSIRISLTDGHYATALAIADSLKTLLNQESVMVMRHTLEATVL